MTRSERTVARIAVDLLGGDGTPAVVVDGALHALHLDPELRLLLVGPPPVLDGALAALHERAGRHPAGPVAVAGRVTRLDCAANGQGATAGTSAGGAVRAAVTAVRDGLADAVVSAGPTASSVAAAVAGLGRLPGVSRPALAAVIPAVAGPVVLLDVGACPDVEPDDLLHHAALGAGYAAALLGAAARSAPDEATGPAAPSRGTVRSALSAPPARSAPSARPADSTGSLGLADPAGLRVGLLSIGTERGKGDRLRREAGERLAGAALPGGARFVGMVEGHHVALGGPADVVVTDGFTGNVLLKGLEGAVAARLDGAAGSPDGQDGRDGRDGQDGRAARAALMLGVAGAFVVCHEAASAADLASGIGLARRAVGAGAPDRVARAHHAFTQEQQNDAGADTPVRTPGGVRP